MVIKCEIIWIIDFMSGVIGFSYFGGIDILMWKKFKFRIYIKLIKKRERNFWFWFGFVKYKDLRKWDVMIDFVILWRMRIGEMFG